MKVLRASKDPSVYTVIGEDSAALAGLIVAFLGVFFGHLFNNPYFDGAASLVIGVILAVVAVFLAYESRGLIVGESVDTRIREGIKKIAEADNAVKQVRRTLDHAFRTRPGSAQYRHRIRPRTAGSELALAVDRLEANIRKEYPMIKSIFIEAEAFKEKKGETPPEV